VLSFNLEVFCGIRDLARRNGVRKSEVTVHLVKRAPSHDKARATPFSREAGGEAACLLPVTFNFLLPFYIPQYKSITTILNSMAIQFWVYVSLNITRSLAQNRPMPLARYL
jgi:hypothetical protein